jgi:hypothetical protein
MKTSSSGTGASAPAPRSPARQARLLIGSACVALLTSAFAAAPAWAGAHGPKYSLKIAEGETTLPEYETIAGTSASVEPSGQLAVSIIRNGITVYRDVENNGWAGLSQVPSVGETVTLEAPVGTLVGSVVYDGLPSIDPTVCAGSTNFSGSNSSGDIVEGFYTGRVLRYDPYGHIIGTHQTSFGEAQVKSLTGATFGGSFLTPLTLGQDVGAVESLKTPLANEATYTYTSEYERPVGGCPPPPPPPYVPPAPPVLSGSLFKLGATTIRKLLRLGWGDQVSINQPGTIVQDVYLDTGKLPAHASARGKRHAKPAPPALLLARGVTTAKAAGTVRIKFSLTARGRRKLKTLKRAKVVVITTLTTASGQKLNLGDRTISLRL